MTNSTLNKRYNVDNSISLISRGRVIFKSKDSKTIEMFLKGWEDSAGQPAKFGRPQFRHTKRTA